MKIPGIRDIIGIPEAPQFVEQKEPENPFTLKNAAEAEQKAWEEALLAERNTVANNNVDAWIYPIKWTNDQMTRQITPEPIQEPEVKVPEIKQPKFNATPKQEIESTPVLKSQEIKSNELANKVAEDKIKAEDNQKALTEFDAALKTGNLEELAILAANNQWLRWDFNSMIKSDLKNKAWIEYFRKYSWMTNEQLQTAVDTWDITIGSDKFNTLPPEQRASFTEYNKIFEASKSWNKDYQNNKFDNDNNNIISTNKEDATISWFQWLDIRKKYSELLNSPEITSSSKKLTNLQDEVNAFNDEIDKIEDQVNEQYPNLPSSVKANIISQRTKSLNRSKNTKINEYNSELGNYTRLKDNVGLELEFAKYEDAQNQATYKAELTAYTAERKQMTEIAIKEFEAKNKIKAEEVKYQRALELKMFEDNLKDKTKSGVYKTDRDGKLLYVVDWVAQEVSQTNWDLVFTEDNTEKEYKDTTYSKEWVYTTVRTYENWDKPDYFTHNINWESTSDLSVYDNLSDIPSEWLQCWAAANKYVSWLWVSTKDFWVWDSYASKSRYIDSTIETPEPWMLAIWNPWSVDSKWWTDYWHIAIVSWPVQPDWTVEITDWNMNWDEKKNTRMVSVDMIKSSDWGFYNPEIPAATFDIADISVFNSLTASEKAKRQDNAQFREIVKQKNAVYADENADPFDVMKFSKWGKDMSTTDNKEIRKFSAVLNSLWEIQETIDEWVGWFFGEWTWPFEWLLRSKDPYDVTAQKLKAQITSLIPNLARWVYWEVWVLTEADVDLYRKTVPNLTQTEDVNRAMLWMTLRLVKRGLETSLTDLARAWTDTSWFEWKLKSINRELEVIENDLAWKVVSTDTTPVNNNWYSAYQTRNNKIDYNKYAPQG